MTRWLHPNCPEVMGASTWRAALFALAWGSLLPALTAQGSSHIETENVATGYVAQTGTYTDDNQVGYNTYRLYIRLNRTSNAQGVYAIYGNDVNPLDLPGARQDPTISVDNMPSNSTIWALKISIFA